jgi:hypothetical protein
MPMTADAALKPLSRLVGTWTTEATHPAVRCRCARQHHHRMVGRGTISDPPSSHRRRWQLRRDQQHWDDDLEITYRRRK